jgi:hypothetical protein
MALNPSMPNVILKSLLNLDRCLTWELQLQLLPLDTLALPHAKDKPLAALLFEAQTLLFGNR